MTKSKHQSYRYSICFKQEVVKEVSRRASLTAVSRKYGIKGNTTAKKWGLRYGDPTKLNEVVYVKMRHEKDELKSLQKEVRRLKIALADKTLALDALESVLEVAGIDAEELKKTIGLPPSGGAPGQAGRA
jgi:transposase-like protein